LVIIARDEHSRVITDTLSQAEVMSGDAAARLSLLGAGVVVGEDRVAAGRSRRRAAARPDEDAVTLSAEAAALALPTTLDRVGAILLATVTPPYATGGSAQALAELLGFQGSVFALDLGGSRRDGLAALRVAAALAGRSGPVLVCAAHAGLGDASSGDGAVALLVGGADDAAEPVGTAIAATEVESLATLTPAASSAIELRDRWILRGETAWREADKSFMQSIATDHLAREIAASVPAQLNAPIVVVGPEVSASAKLERALRGVEDTVTAHTGPLGAAHPLLRLLAALDGPPSLVVAVSNGLGEALHVAPAPGGAELARHTRELCEQGGTRLDRAPAVHVADDFDPYASVPRAWRDRDVDLRLKGLVGPAGGLSPVPGRRHPRGRVVARTEDFVYPAARSTELASVEMDAGGQFYGQVAMGEEVSLGDQVELVPRRLHHGGGMIQYFWKAKPCP
jgi:hypothetical protein